MKNNLVEVHVQKAKNKHIAKLGVQKFNWDFSTGRYETYREQIEPTGNFNGFSSNQASLYK